ncbi:MAG TPA: hypothetical protein VMM58_12360 [Bacteroidota bacterium]|nr:hypothetical protein [Bacteroidota bacterium]
MQPHVRIMRSSLSVEFIQQLQTSLPPFQWPFFLLFIPFFLTMAIDALAWQFLFPRANRPNYFALLKTHVATEAIFLSLPGGFAAADVTKIFLLHKEEGIDSAEIVVSLLGRRWILGMSQVAFIMLCCLLDFGIMQNGLTKLFDGTGLGWVALAFAVVIVAVLVIAARLMVAGRFAGTLFKAFVLVPIPYTKRWLMRHEDSFRQADECFKVLSKGNKATLFVVLVLYTTTWAVEALETFLIAHYIGFDIGMTKTLIIEAILSIVKEAVFFLPSGVVVKDLGYVTLFNSFAVILSPMKTLAFVVMKRLTMLVWIVIGYSILLIQGTLPMIKQRPVAAPIVGLDN